MRLFAVLLLILVIGWSLGWYSHQQWGGVEPRVLVLPREQPTRDSPSPLLQPSLQADNSIESLLKRNDFDTAVDRYELLQQLDGTAAADARLAFLARGRALLAVQDYEAASRLLQRFLALEYRDVDAMQLLAEVYSGSGQYNQAIEALYEARGYAWRANVLEHLTRRIRATVERLDRQLQETQDNTGRLDLYLHLTRLEPEYAAYFIALAKAQLALDDRASARNSLLLVSRDADVGVQAQAMLAELQPADEEPEEQPAGIPLERKGRHFLVDASAGGVSAIRLLIDTGASLTILSSQIIENSGMTWRDTGKVGRFTTANGRVEAPLYIIDSLVIGNWQVRDLEVGVLEMQGQDDIDGLLGMNFLQHFRFFIDQDDALLHLSLR